MLPVEDNGWHEWKNHVLAELIRLANAIEEQNAYTVAKRTECNNRFNCLENWRWYVVGIATVGGFVGYEILSRI